MHKEIDVEQMLTKEQFVSILRGVADAIEQETEYRTTLQQEEVVVPAHADMSIEYEIDEHGGELELSIEWMNVPETEA